MKGTVFIIILTWSKILTIVKSFSKIGENTTIALCP